MAGHRKAALHNMDVVRHNVEHIVLRCAAEGMQPGAIRSYLLSRHSIDISAAAIDHYVKRAMEDPKIQAAVQLHRQRGTTTTKSVADFMAEVEKKIAILDGLMEDVRRRYADGQTLTPRDLRNWLFARGVRPSPREWSEFMTIIEQQSLDRAIINIVTLQRELRAWLETQMRLMQILPGEDKQSLTDIAQMIAQLMPMLCEPCQLQIAGVRQKSPEVAALKPSAQLEHSATRALGEGPNQPRAEVPGEAQEGEKASPGPASAEPGTGGRSTGSGSPAAPGSPPAAP